MSELAAPRSDHTDGSEHFSNVTAAFEHAFSSSAAGVWSAPGRVNLIGEHTDYNDGLCLPIALPQRTLVAAARRRDSRLRLRSLQDKRVYELDLGDIGPGRPDGWGGYAAGVLWALDESGRAVGGMDLLVDGQVPVGAGLSSSAALECAVAAAASDLFGLGLLGDDPARAALAQICVRAENTVAQAPTGGMDQAVALRSRAGHALLLDCRDGSIEQVDFDLAGHGLSLLVMDTRAPHQLVDGQYAERRRSCDEAARQLGVATLREVPAEGLDATLDGLSDKTLRRRTRHVVTEIQRVVEVVAALVRDDFAAVGQLFDASHLSMRDDFEISCPELDLAVETATAQGALGARMTGGGFGGSAIALVDATAIDQVRSAVTDAFAREGHRSPHCFPVTASGPASRER